MRDIAAKTDAAAREGCCEKGCALEAKSGADKKRGDADLLAKEQHVVSETRRDFAALKKSKKSNIAAKATNNADEKYNASDFAAKDAGKKPRAINLSAQGTGEKFDTVDSSVKISNDAGKKFDTNSLVARFKNLPVQTEQESGADVLAANALITHF